jgi:hypothetical protein
MYRPGDLNILKEPPEFKIDPDVITEDVVQGDLGDCYFLSALSALAEFPKRIRNLIPNQNILNQGVFEAVVYIHGEPTRICVDDYFPVHLEGENAGKLAFVGINPKTNNIWPLILEKVWAKVNLNYEEIIAGHSAEAFEFLSPAPIDTYYHEVHADTLYQDIKSADEKNYIICSDITATANTNIFYLSKMGLITNHAYTVVDVAEISDLTGKITRLLKIRNPWGSNEWTGDWSDKSTKWTPEIKKLLNYDDSDDGTFWMSYEDFTKFYTTTHICKIHDDYNFISSKLVYDKNKSYNIVQLTVPKDSSGFFIVNQKNTRIYRHAKGLDDFENRYCSIIVFRQEKEGNNTYIGAACGTQNRLYVQCDNIVKGNYFVAIAFPTHSDHVSTHDHIKEQRSKAIADDHITYRVAIYANVDKVTISSIPDRNHLQFVNFLQEIIYDMAKKSDNKYFFEEEGEKDSWRAISFEKGSGAYGYILYENNSDGFIHEHLTITEFYNVNLIPILGNGMLSHIDTESESQVEDVHERTAIEILKSRMSLQSGIDVINVVPHGEEVTEKNPIELIVKVAPKSICLICIEKYSEDAGIDMTSRIAITYPTHVLIDEKKFPAKRTRIKYNNKFVEIHETVIEHNSGVIFKYKNLTKDLKFAAHITFPDLDNLLLSLKSEDLKHKGSKEDNYGSVEPSAMEFEVEDSSREVVINLEPGESRFFELAAKDLFESFSYSCQMNFHINLARGGAAK